jgi:hypothetical protein
VYVSSVAVDLIDFGTVGFREVITKHDILELRLFWLISNQHFEFEPHLKGHFNVITAGMELVCSLYFVRRHSREIIVMPHALLSRSPFSSLLYLPPSISCLVAATTSSLSQ